MKKKTEIKIFDDGVVDLMIKPERWKIISSVIPVEDPPADPKGFMKRAAGHQHEHAELLFAMKGNFFQSFKGVYYPCVPGSLFIFRPHEAHNAGYPSKVPPLAHLWMMLVRDRMFMNLYTSLGKRGVFNSKKFLLGHAETAILLKTLDDIENASFSMSDAWKRTKIVTAVSNVFLYVLDKIFSIEENKEQSDSKNMAIETIMRHIEENPGGAQNLDMIAHMAGYSKYHFSRIFKKHAGCTVHTYINLCRMKALKHMKKDGMMKKNMASSLGFSCPSAFANWERKMSDS